VPQSQVAPVHTARILSHSDLRRDRERRVGRAPYLIEECGAAHCSISGEQTVT
jgi:hypothetical protein